MKKASVSSTPDIYHGGRASHCSFCQSLATSPDSNEGCHWGVEGRSCPRKGKIQRGKTGSVREALCFLWRFYHRLNKSGSM